MAMLLQLLLTSLILHQVYAYKPLVIVHGIFSDPTHFDGFVKMVTKAHPGTNITVIKAFDGPDSLAPLWSQVEKFRSDVKAVVDNNPQGIHLLCYSQGGVICRGLIATFPNHKIDTFISLSCPLLGQYGVTDVVKKYIRAKFREDVYKICYTEAFQVVSVCNYWNDPHQREKYLKENIYLPPLNNETYNSKSLEWKKNFLQLKKLILIGGPDDGVITPWQSSQFGFYDANENIVEMTNQEVFLKDSFGLQSMHDSGRIQTYTISGVAHTSWHDNQTVFDKCIEPWLT
ncbi:lysosomal thioesterase PPT2-A-like [Anneissia japonica]|uniref:lysosomal thioesterase PPT2-A-like n=1 Tax=Anneissia japonica TaxID=1529436 RepID=UPI0014256B79|nr:lysosomal thioesterase PPT2-A-like [Anneissia japonica]XP_033098771.1 lysosomal thioesterase PPT2-A-like [Anneissia japonica]XP_033098781.1 lysosomal thioesterase PPT2-A-like [Anneissia japonica]